MKKQLIAAAITASISMPSMADFLGVYAGLDYRTNQTSISDANLDDDSTNVAGYIAFEHPIPVLPNAKLKYSDLTNDVSDDSSSLNGILYYELFDNGLFEFDFGLAYTDIEAGSESASIGQGYVAAKAHVPTTGIHAFAEVIGGSVTDDNSLDAEAGLQYTINPDSLLLNVGIRAGYRYQELEFKNVANTQTNDGWFAGVEVHF